MSLSQEIIAGQHDEELDQIREALQIRRKLKSQEATAIAMATLKAGDKVILKNLSPKYINGLTAKVVEKRRSKIAVLIDEGQHTGRFGRHVTCPASCLEKV